MAWQKIIEIRKLGCAFLLEHTWHVVALSTTKT